MTTTITRTTEQEARRRKTVVWVVSLAFVGLLFDGYDLVVYGAVLSTFLRDPTPDRHRSRPHWAGRWAATRWSVCCSGRCSPAPSPT